MSGSFGLLLGVIEQGPKIGVGDSFGVPFASSLESSRYSLSTKERAWRQCKFSSAVELRAFDSEPDY